MATKAFTRRPRLSRPVAPEGEIALEPPPELPRESGMNILMIIMPVAMIAMVVGFVVLGGANSASLMMGGMMVMMAVGMLSQMRSGRGGKAELATSRRDYLSYLGKVRGQVDEARTAQRAEATWTNPSPATLWSLAGGRRMWERRQHDGDFMQVRIATGASELVTPLLAPQTGPMHEVDPISAVALSQLVRTHEVVEELPIAIQLRTFPVVALTGDLAASRALVRAMLCSLATFHGPDGLLVVAAVDSGGRAEWDWLKWLPHNLHPREHDGLGPLRMVTGEVETIETWLDDELATRPPHPQGPGGQQPPEPGEQHLVIVIDGGAGPTDISPLAALGLAGVTVIDLSGATGWAGGEARLDLVVRPDQVGLRTEAEPEWLGAPDRLDLTEADALARRLAPYRLAERGSADDEGAILSGLAGSTDLADMLGLGALHHLTPEQVWKPRTGRDLMRVPIGVGPTGEMVELDLKESAFGGMGPHGLVIGATGSGKSELLRTLVLALAVTHSPEQLNLVLVDFKGGATFLGLQDLPHTAAVITNLQDDLSMVDRMYDALSGEMNRRQELLRDAGNLLNIRDYERVRGQGAPLEPMPWLLIVCDEFTELLTQKPDFAELFVAIGRLGRSLGVHLLLASQRLEEGKLRGLDSHLSYRVGLKTFSAQESRVVLGVTDAYELPPVPGSGFLKFDTEGLHRFKAAYVSGPYQPKGGRPSASPDTVPRHQQPVSFVSSVVDLGPDETETEVEVAEVEPDKNAPSVLDTIVGRLEGHGRAHEVWLPPLETSPTLDQLLPGGVGAGPLRATVGIVDLPYEQRRDPYVLNFSAAQGNGVVVGGPQTGKSTALRTIITSLALTHTPEEVQFYVIDLGGGSLGSTAALPHVGGVATRGNPDFLRRLVAEVTAVVVEREERFRERGVESMADYRAMQRRAREQGPDAAAPDSPTAGDPFGDVFLVVDGWGVVREEFEDVEARIVSLAARGLSFGVHVIISSGRWTEVRANLRDNLGTRVELRLGDPFESEVDRRLAQNVPTGAPGRGLAPNKRHMLLGLPRIDGESDPSTLAAAYGELTRRVSEGWTGRRAPAVRTLPDRLPLSELTRRVEAMELPAGSRAIPVGINEEALAPVLLDFDADPHLVVFTDTESGKTNLLKVLVAGIMERYTHQEVRILPVDYRRGLLGLVPKEYLAGYASGAPALTALIRDLGALLESRLPGPDITAEQLRDRSWWSGPEVFILVDDYDLVATSDNPLTLLRPLIAQARDIGLHLVLVRRTAGASRATYDPLVQGILELGSRGMVGSGSRDEGTLIGGVRPEPRHPAGRVRLITRRQGVQAVQIALADE